MCYDFSSDTAKNHGDGPSHIIEKDTTESIILDSEESEECTYI